MKLTRRGFVSAMAGLSVASRVSAADEVLPPAVALVFVRGGFGASHVAADTMRGSFSLGDQHLLPVAGGFSVDRTTFGLLGADALSRLAVVGVDHGMTAHDAASNGMFNGSKNHALTLAAAMQGRSPIRCAALGALPAPFGAVAGASVTPVIDMFSALNVLVGSTDPKEPRRELSAAGLRSAYRLSRPELERAPTLLRSHVEGYDTIVSSLSAPVQQLDWQQVASAYGLEGGTTAVGSVPSQFAAAELLITGGVPMVLLTPSADRSCGEAGWDTHGDSSGECFRRMWNERVTPHVSRFLSRTLTMRREVTTVVFGEFARDPSLSDHARGVSVAVFGPRVKPGSTGRAFHRAGKFALPEGTPGIQQLWAYLAAVVRAQGSPFGINPHTGLV